MDMRLLYYILISDNTTVFLRGIDNIASWCPCNWLGGGRRDDWSVFSPPSGLTVYVLTSAGTCVKAKKIKLLLLLWRKIFNYIIVGDAQQQLLFLFAIENWCSSCSWSQQLQNWMLETVTANITLEIRLNCQTILYLKVTSVVCWNYMLRFFHITDLLILKELKLHQHFKYFPQPDRYRLLLILWCFPALIMWCFPETSQQNSYCCGRKTIMMHLHELFSAVYWNCFRAFLIISCAFPLKLLRATLFELKFCLKTHHSAIVCIHAFQDFNVASAHIIEIKV